MSWDITTTIPGITIFSDTIMEEIKTQEAAATDIDTAEKSVCLARTVEEIILEQQDFFSSRSLNTSFIIIENVDLVHDISVKIQDTCHEDGFDSGQH